MEIRAKLVLLFVSIAIVIILVSGIIFIVQGKASLSYRIEAQLESVVVLKENQLNRFIELSTAHAEEIAELDLIKNYLTDFHIKPVEFDEEKEEEREREILDMLNKKIKHTDFIEIFVITLNGEVDISTDASQKKKIKAKERYFTEGKKGAFVQNFYYDITLNEPAITVSSPVINKEGEVIGVLAGRVYVQRISELMTERSGLGETGETYLVNKFNFVVSKLKKEEGAVLKKTIYTDTVKSCLNGNNGFGYYNDYLDEGVLGFYKWIPEREVCLLAEIDQEEAFASINELTFTVFLIGLVLAILSVIGGILMAQSISKPIKELRDGAVEIGKGNLNTKIKIQSKDEIGQLASSFIQMAKDLKKSRGKLREYSTSLERDVKKRTKTLQSKIDEMETFQKITVGREMKMAELKKEIKGLKEKLKNK